MSSPISIKVDLLLKQNRAQDAIRLLRNHLSQHPEDVKSQLQLSLALYLNHELRESREMAEALLAEHPMEFGIVNLLAEIDLTEEKYSEAESKSKYLLELDPENPHFHLLVARIKEAQRFYDSAIQHLNKALELDPGHVDALNFKAVIAERVGNDQEVASSIRELLALDPDNPTSIANHGLQLLNQGNVEGALTRFQEALALQASNPLARHGMQEALKSKFWIYRMFFHYKKFISKLSGQQAWIFIIGSYIGYRLLAAAAANSEGILKTLLTLIVILIAATFLLSWVINPLMNLFLWTNKFGKVLLDKEAKIMAKYTGISLALSLSFIMAYFVLSAPGLLITGAFFAGMMIPAGTFLLPTTEEKQKKLRIFGLIILGLGLLGLLLPNSSGNMLFWGAILGLLGYQFYFNRMMINEFSRKFE